MTNIFICRCPNRAGVGVIDEPDRSEQVLGQRYIPDDIFANYHLGIFFLGGGFEVFFAIWPISSYVGVQIVRELVRLMTPIGLNKYLTNVTSPTSLKKFFTHDILMIRRQKTLIFDVLKAFTSNFTYYNLY